MNSKQGQPVSFAITIVVAAVCLWSTAGLFTRIIHTDVWTILFWRCAFGGLAMLIWLTITSLRTRQRPKFSLGYSGWVIALLITASTIGYVNAFMHTSVSNVAVIYATVPIFASTISWVWLKEKPRISTVIASLICLGAVSIVVGQPALSGGWIGDVLALLMTILMAIITVMARRYPDTPVIMAVALSALLGAIIALPLANNLFSLDLKTMGLLVCFGVLNLAGGFALYTYGARLLPSSHVALIGLLEVPLQPFLVYVFVNEIPTVNTIIGGCIILSVIVAHEVICARKAAKLEGKVSTSII